MLTEKVKKSTCPNNAVVKIILIRRNDSVNIKSEVERL